MATSSVTTARVRLWAAWRAGLAPLLLLGVAIAAFVALDAPGLDRRGAPLEELVVDGTALYPGKIQLRLQNDGPDPVAIAQVIVNDAFTSFTQTDESIGRLGRGTVTIPYPWIEGQSYEIALLTSTGSTAEAFIPAATESPPSSRGFFGLMALVGLYVGIIPVAIGMLWLPWVRRIDQRWMKFLLALTVGMLMFLAIDAILEGAQVAGAGAQSLGGTALVYLGAAIAYLALTGVDAHMDARSERAAAAGAAGFRLALFIAIGIGLHNLGEGLAIGSAHAIGSLALGSSLIVGFALHNTTEGLAIIAPVASVPPPLRRLVVLGLIAGAPTVLGAWIGALGVDTSLAALMLGLGVGAIAQIVVKIAPSIADATGRLLHPLAVAGLLSGLTLMYATGLLVSA